MNRNAPHQSNPSMLAENVENPPLSQAAHRASFFRQSGWLMIANIGGGVLMWAVHLLNKAIPASEYGNFGFFLAIVMLLPAIPLQMILTQQTAKALAIGRQGELAGVVRAFAGGAFLLWACGAVIVLLFQQHIVEHWHMSNPAGLWITLPVVLVSLWLPMIWGVLQGQQNFLWLGWSMLANAVGRFSVAAVAVLLLHAYAAGMMTGVLIGVIASALIGVWQTRGVWFGQGEPFDARGLLRQAVPLLLAFLGFQILFTVDTIFVKSYFPENVAGFYVSAGTLSRALMWLVLPLASVMFPRLVHSAARSEKSNLMGVVLMGTGLLAVTGALGLWLVGPWVVRLIYKPEFVQVASSILPWYAFAMVPLSLANVLLNNLLARPDSKWGLALSVFLLSVAYMIGLTEFHTSLVTVLKTVGAFNLLLLGLCGWFSLKH
ncbi:MAG TPA: lipid II flippase MurJ [Candidatus Limnocylindrales bacterium]|nr:lipid II flippase MurJ [Candidatus Limnocylindrales bacterium]